MAGCARRAKRRASVVDAGFCVRRAAQAYRSIVSFVDGVLLDRTMLVELASDDVIDRGLAALLAGIDRQRGIRRYSTVIKVGISVG